MSHPTYLDRPLGVWVTALSSDDPLQRRLGAYALGEIGVPAPEALEALTTALGDDVSFVRVWAAAALLNLDAQRRDATAVLVAGSRDERGFVRSLSGWLLGRQGRRTTLPEPALATLHRLVDDDDPSVRTEAGLALERLRIRG